MFENYVGISHHLNVLCISNSNASPERVWSKYVLEKTKIRNRLNFASIRGLLLTSQYIKDVGGILIFKPTPSMIQRMKELSSSHKRKISFKSTNKGKQQNLIFGSIEITNEMLTVCQQQERSYLKKYKRSCPQSDLDLVDAGVKNMRDEACTPRKRIKFENDANSLKQNVVSALHDIDVNVCNITTNQVLYVSLNESEARICNIMENGLRTDLKYYSFVNYEFTIGRYHPRNDHPIRDQRNVDENFQKITQYSPDHEFQLFSKEFQTLYYIDEAGYLDGDVIDAYAARKEHEWKDTVAFPTQQSKILLVDNETLMPSTNWSMFHIKGYI